MPKESLKFSWDKSYESIQSKRLWPEAPTVKGLDFELWRKHKINRVLDAGCGDGKNMAYVIDNGFYCVGVDASLSALKLCNDYLKRLEYKNFTLYSDIILIESMPFDDDEFKAAICVDVLGHIVKPKEIISELARVLCPGGFLYASVFHPDDSCHQSGLRMESGERPGDFWYTPSVKNPSEPNLRYYYHFYSENEARNLFNSNKFELISLERREWQEPGHEKYREEDHTHVSWFALMKRKEN